MTSIQCRLLTTTSQFSPSKNHRQSRRRSPPRMPKTRLQYSTRPSIVSSKKTLYATRVDIPNNQPICPTSAGNLLRMKNFKSRLRASVARKGEGQSKMSSIRDQVSFSCGSSMSLRETLEQEEKSSLSRYSTYQNITIEIFLKEHLPHSNDLPFDPQPEPNSSALSIYSTTVFSCTNLAALMFSLFEGRHCLLKS